MQHKRHGGFTLIEVMLVVLIGVVVTLFSVPAYRKNQDKNRYLAASGVLMDLGNAARMFHADYPNVSIASCSVSGNLSNNASATPTECGSGDSTWVGWLHTNKYLNNIPFSGGLYMQYSFFISSVGTANCGTGCLNLDGGAMACMKGSNVNAEYRCAWITRDGQLRTKSIN